MRALWQYLFHHPDEIHSNQSGTSVRLFSKIETDTVTLPSLKTLLFRKIILTKFVISL